MINDGDDNGDADREDDIRGENDDDDDDNDDDHLTMEILE